MEVTSVVTITERELAHHLEAATSLVASIPVRVPREERGASAATLGGRRIAYRPMLGMATDAPLASTPATTRVNLAEALKAVSPADDLLSDAEHRVLRAARRAVQVAHEVHACFERASGLGARAAGEGRVRELDGELRELRETAVAVALHAGAAFLVKALEPHVSEEGAARTVELDAPGHPALGGKAEALGHLLGHLVTQVRAHARDDDGLTRVVVEAARAVAEQVRELAGALRKVEVYTGTRYRLEADDVTLAGFELGTAAAVVAVEVQEKRPEEVVGNHVAKFEAMRLAQRLVCYDMGRQRNPFVDLGGFSFSFLGDGSPGTGKTTLIQMTVSLLREYCATLGLPFRYRNFSVDEISDYQGRSAQNAKRFCAAVMDPSGIGFGTVDDVDQVCASRDDKNASAGQLEVTAVLMQELAGAGTIVRGNATFGLFSNYPEKVDDALRQRTQARFLVDGPQSREDFTDLLLLLLGDAWEMPHGEGYTPFSTQAIRQVIRARYAEHDRPHDPALLRLFEEHARGGEIATWIEFGNYLKALQEHDPRFTGRAVKNITDAVKFRMMDFDLPAEWLEKPELFFTRPYEEKVAMLKELRGEVTPRVVLQEIHRYVDAEARYGAVAAARRLASRTDDLRLEVQARAALAEEVSG